MQIINLRITQLPALFFLILVSFSAQVFAKSSVWKVEKNGNTVYFGGTVHALHASEFPLPEAFDKAYEAAKIITLEADVTPTPELMQASMSKLIYSGDKTIQNQTSAEVYKKLKEYADSLQFPLQMLPNAKPFMLMTVFMEMELKKIDISLQEGGVDKYFQEIAKEDNKTLHYLETALEQLDLIADVGVGSENDFYTYMLRDMKNLPKDFKKIVQFWRAGEAEKLDEYMNRTMKDYPGMEKTLLIDRNNNWLPKIEKYFDTKEVEFVLVGAGHLVGKHSVINLLKQKGYKVTQL